MTTIESHPTEKIICTTEGNKENAEAAYKAAVKSVDRAVSKGLLHKNNAARKKSSMASKMNALSE